MSQYYYTDGKDRFGPFSLDEIREQGILETTLVWREGLSDWVPASQLPELAFPASVPPPPQTYFTPGHIPGHATEKPPKNWLLESILVTFFCCIPLGIVGIINATKVDTLWYAGKYDEAHKAAADAAKWTKIGAGIGIVVIVLYFILIMTGVFTNLVLPQD